MVDSRNKRKKHHDKDKYYRLAKEQGLRSRAAFKLVQINKKFPLLQKCQAGVLDLCAAPGGWTQIAARTCPKHVPIVAVDILPIRATGHANVTTIVGDITTDKCKSDIQRAVRDANLQQSVDLVLHDGAPNVGAEYGKDAYEQNELTIHALRCATQHLKAGGHFITKVYRSRDYASLQWLLQQLFGQVQALKPAASRSQSAEIFLICQHYKAPAKLDPRLLDPKYIFEEVAGDSTGGVMSGSGPAAGTGIATAASAGMSIFHKNWDKPRRKRGGYDLEHLDATMRHIESVQHFVSVSSLQAAIQILSTSTGLAFQCEVCKEKTNNAQDNDGDDEDDGDKCLCAFFKNHPLTTPEIKECITDLQVLNKSDFKGLLTWRTKMQDAVRAKRDMEGSGKNESDTEASDVSAQSDSDEEEIDSDQEEQNIQNEIIEMRQRRQREKKRQKKKEREAAAKRRQRAALGMDLNAIDVPEHDKLFSLATITSKGDLEAAAEVNLDRVSDEQLFGGENSDEDVVIGKEEENDEDLDDDERRRRRERDLEEAYGMYLESTKNAAAKTGTRMAKRSKKSMIQKVMEEAAEDQEMVMASAETLDYNARTYADMLQGPRDSEDEDSSSDEDEDDGYNAEPMTPEEHAQKHRAKRQKKSGAHEPANPLIHNFADEPASVKTTRWFSNPVFSLMGKAAESNEETAKRHDESESSDEEENGLDSDESSDDASHLRGKESKKAKGKSGLTADEVLSSMPKTDKQIRHEKRLKALEREEHKRARRAKRLGEAEGDFELAPANEESQDDTAADDLAHLSDSQKKKVLEARELIKAGMGKIANDDDNDNGIEIVSSEDTRPLPVMDNRKYDSDHVDYDSDDYAQTLALGTMMLRRSKEKALVDASYNRYAWNDPEDLPEWFVDDEAKHYRPQLPIPPALIAKMKERMMALSAKPIKKVAEARARKNKRAKAKLAVAKKQAEAVANSSEMSEAMKLKAISKALRGQETKKPGKSYVVAKKGRAGQQGGKGIKLVDKRMKSDKRGLERAEKKRKKKRKRSHR